MANSHRVRSGAVVRAGLATAGLSAGLAWLPLTEPAVAAPPATRAAVIGGAGDVAASDPFPPASPVNVVKVTGALFPAVVRLDVAHPVEADGRETVERGIGSGVIIDAAGRILTNYHVAGRATEIFVTLSNKERVRGKLLGDDHWTDLAVVQMDMDEVRARHVDFRWAELGTSGTLVPGQDVMAIGTPFGLARTLTIGTVSNVERTLDHVEPIDGFETGGYSNWIQMDVPINPGNSGGPLVAFDAKVVGINTRGGAQNLNFAIPIDTAKVVIASILHTATPGLIGHMERSDLGMSLRPLQGLESFYKLDFDHGVLIDSVDRFSAAEKAGVRSQDVLLAVNGKPTNVRFPEEAAPVMQRLAALPVGQPATLSLLRGGRPLEVTATPAPLQSVMGEPRAFPAWGVSARDVTTAYANAKQFDTDGGVVVTVVKQDSPAATAGLEPGDVIESVDGRPVADAAVAVGQHAANRRIAGDAHRAPQPWHARRPAPAGRPAPVELTPADLPHPP